VEKKYQNKELALAKKIEDMPYTKVFIHYIWATKNREHLISKELKPLLLKHIKENSIKKEIFIDALSCVSDHIHLLVSLGKEQTIAKTAMLIKGESSFWVNKQDIIKAKFEWQDEYIALSVSYSAIDKVRAYIVNQEEHHKRKAFADEYKEFLEAHHFENILAKANILSTN
jgi:REP element-mobilizing transposase RayT